MKECIAEGRKVQGAKFVSWDTNASGLCLVYDSCDLINGLTSLASQSSTITSSVECECRMPGLCRGPVYDRKLVSLEKDCAELCEGNRCAYYSYLVDQKICLLFKRCEVMEKFPNTFSAIKSSSPVGSQVCKMDKMDKMDTGEKQLLLYLFYKKKSSTAFVNLVSLTEPNTSCQLLSFRHQNKVKYLGYVENMNAVVACLKDLPDCYTFDGLNWQPLTTQRIPSCFDDSFQVIPQGLVNVKGKSKPGQGARGRCEADEIISEIYTGQEWVNLEVEDAKITKLPLEYIWIPWWSSSRPVFSAMDAENNNFWWSLDYENRKWISIPEPVMDYTGIDFNSFPDEGMQYRWDGEGYLGFYRHEKEVYQIKELNDTWTPIPGVFRPLADDHDPGDPPSYDLVPKSFGVGC